MKLPSVPRPCKNCPFRKDTRKGWLGEDRAKEISEQDSFVCHKTVDYSEEEKTEQRRQCAGFMLIKKNESVFYRMAKVMNIDLNLSGEELVFNSKEEFIKHHK